MPAAAGKLSNGRAFQLIREFPIHSPSGLPSMSAVPTISIVEDLEAALQQFAAIAADIKNKGVSCGSPILIYLGACSIGYLDCACSGR
jgi:hypothetical protein